MNKHARMLSQLCLLLALALPGWLPAADDEAEDADLAYTKLCESKPDSDDDAAGETCEQLQQELIEEARQEITTEIAEDTQNAHTLRTLLLGRNYILFGRVGLEFAVYSGDIPTSENGGDLRRLRFGIAGLATFFDRVSYKLELDLTDGTNNFSDLYVQWDTRKHGSIKVGNQRVSQNLSAMTSSLSQMFMERPLPVTTFSLRRRLAVSYDLDRGRWGMHGMFFTRDPNNDAGKYGWAFRLITKPIRGPEKIGHVGFSLVRRKWIARRAT